MSRFLSIAVVLALVAGLLVSAAPAAAAPPPPNYKPIDIGPKLRELGPSDVTLHTDGYESVLSASGAAASSGAPELYGEGDLITAIWYDDLSGLWLADYEVKAIGEHIEVWVMTDLSFPDGDPRNPVEVTDDQIAYLVDEFDNNIYPKMIDFFGPPDFHDGSGALFTSWGLGDYYDAEGRTIAMVSNIGDESYYDPTYPNYIAGFYWGSVFELYLDRNVISIDAYDWENRVGPDGSRPYLYEGVFAHEYQHLLHDDYDSDEENFVNEGLSMFAEFQTGYVSGNDAYSTFEAFPENSLVAWGDQGGREIVADYGNVFLYQMYLYEKFGQSFIQDEFHNPLNGIDSINSTLTAHGASATFGDLYHDFSVAVLIDSEMEDYKYGFEVLDVAIDIGHQGQRNPEAYSTPGAPPWGTDYYLLWGYESLAGFNFNGVPFNPLAWTSDGEVLYSGTGDLVDYMAIFDATGGGTLTFDTSYQIEDYWDFGFVQVSTDGGYTWTSLANEYTTYAYAEGALPQAIDNLPGLTGTQDWTTMSFDLSAYSGDILIAFRYMTDWAYAYPGWWIDNVYVDGTLISDGSSTAAFKSLAQQLGVFNNYVITLVGERNQKGKSVYEVKRILDGGYTGSFADFKYMFDNYRTVTMLITFEADPGVTTYAEYSFEFINGGDKVFKNK